MNEIMNINTVQQYNDYFGIETRHPLVSVIDGREAKPLRFCRKLYNLYAILLKDTDCGQLKYGRSIYDYQKGRCSFLLGQVLGSEGRWIITPIRKGWVVFHPELYEERHCITMRDYSYFSYYADKALRSTGQEPETVIECMERIKEELQYPIDKHSKSLITDNIKLFLDYCTFSMTAGSSHVRIRTKTHLPIRGIIKRILQFRKTSPIWDTVRTLLRGETLFVP